MCKGCESYSNTFTWNMYRTLGDDTNIGFNLTTVHFAVLFCKYTSVRAKTNPHPIADSLYQDINFPIRHKPIPWRSDANNQ